MELAVRHALIPDHITEVWQGLVNVVSELIEVPSVMINRLKPPELEVFRSNKGKKNPFPTGTTMPMAGVYCESAARKRRRVEVRDARKDPEWADSPTAKAGIYAYLGYPLFWPGGDIFGTICAIDTKENKWPKQVDKLLQTIKVALESHLTLVDTYKELDKRNGELHYTLKALEDEVTRRKALMDQSTDGILVIGNDHRIMEANRSFADMLGYTVEELIGMRSWEYVVEYDEERIRKEFPSLHEARREFESFHRRKDGSVVPVEVSLSGNLNLEEPLVLAVVRDITERKRSEAELQRLACTDSLTGAWNRRHFLEMADHEFKRCRRYDIHLSVFMLDIDNFKELNDTYGHDAGDKVLQACVEVFGRTIREVDMFARFGGDEFAGLLVQTERETAEIICERLRQNLADRVVTCGSKKICFTASIGVAVLQKDDSGMEEILKRADRALYRGKMSGRNQVVGPETE